MDRAARRRAARRARRNTIFTDILKSLVNNPERVGQRMVPIDRIGTIDSRMWDPEWEYRDQYLGLFNSLDFGFGFKQTNQAMTMASGVSFYWGRGRTPPGVLKSLANMTPRQVNDRFMGFVRRIRGGETLENILTAIGDPVADDPGPSSAVPGPSSAVPREIPMGIPIGRRLQSQRRRRRQPGGPLVSVIRAGFAY